jgi:hypothetical protein
VGISGIASQERTPTAATASSRGAAAQPPDGVLAEATGTVRRPARGAGATVLAARLSRKRELSAWNWSTWQRWVSRSSSANTSRASSLKTPVQSPNSKFEVIMSPPRVYLWASRLKSSWAWSASRRMKPSSSQIKRSRRSS